MNRFLRCVLPSILAGSAALAGAGCEDAAARERDEIQKAITKASLDLQALTGSGNSAGSEHLRKGLDGVLAQLKLAKGGDAGQQSAKSIVAATALREQASLTLAEIEGAEREQRAGRQAVSERIEAAQRLYATAGGYESVNSAAQREALQRELQSVQQRAGDLGAQLQTLQAPIDQRAQRVQNMRAEIVRLRGQTQELVGAARELGYSGGLETFERAAAIGRDADKIELQVAQEEIQLDYTLEPEARLAKLLVSQLQELTQAISATLAELQAADQAIASQSQKIRSQVTAMAKEVDAALDRLSKEREESIKPLYEQATAALADAAQQAEQAGRGGAGQSLPAARVIAARIHQTHGRVLWTQADALAGQRSILEQRAAAAAGLGPNAAAKAAVVVLGEVQAAALEQAKAEFAAAHDAIAQVQTPGNQATIDQFRTKLEAVSAAMAAPASAPAPVAAPPNLSLTLPGAAPPASTPFAPSGADSPQALAQTLKTIGLPGAPLNLFAYVIPIEQIKGLQPGARSFFLNFRAYSDGLAALDRSLQARFGRGVNDVEALASVMQGQQMLRMSDVTIERVDADHGTASVTMATGERHSLPVSRINDRWFLGDPDQDRAGLGALLKTGPAGPGASADPKAQEMMEGFMSGLSQTVATMGKTMTDLAKAVDGGSFSTFEQFSAELQKRLGASMMPVPGAGSMPRMNPPASK